MSRLLCQGVPGVADVSLELQAEAQTVSQKQTVMRD